MTTFEGSCLCGAIKYSIEGESLGLFLCHCSRCRKVTGSAHGANMFVKAERVNWLSGEDKLKVFLVEGTRFGKAFCSNCSSAMPRQHANHPILIPAGSLDSELNMKATAHICCTSRANWDDGFADVPQIPHLP